MLLPRMRGEQPGLAPLYPEIEPYDHGLLDVGDGHHVYWETCGNPGGKPAVVLRRHLGIERWLVLGASWGSTLALAYGQAHREAVSGWSSSPS